jgi:ubiquinone/menaquinone biosynthesis C-methylase UbiE
MEPNSQYFDYQDSICRYIRDKLGGHIQMQAEMSTFEKERAYWDNKANQAKLFSTEEIANLKLAVYRENIWWKDLAPHFRNKRVIDIGCGTSEILAYFGLSENDCVGIDISKGELKWAIKNHKNLNLDAKFVNSSIKNIPFKDGYFDVVHMRWVIHHLSKDEIKESLVELHRLLQNNGQVLLYETNYLYPLRWIVQTPHLKRINIFRKLAIKKGLLDPEEKALTNFEYMQLLEEVGFKIEAVAYQESVLYYLSGISSNKFLKQIIKQLDDFLSSCLSEIFCFNVMIIAKKP